MKGNSNKRSSSTGADGNMFAPGYRFIPLIQHDMVLTPAAMEIVRAAQRQYGRRGTAPGGWTGPAQNVVSEADRILTGKVPGMFCRRCAMTLPEMVTLAGDLWFLQVMCFERGMSLRSRDLCTRGVLGGTVQVDRMKAGRRLV